MANKTSNRRVPIELIPGQHQAIIPLELYKRNQMIRLNKGTSPSQAAKPVHQPLLTGIARCWECLDHDATESNIRSVPGRPGKRYSQCARIQDCYPSKRSNKHKPDNVCQKKELKAIHIPATDDLLARHRSTLAEELLETQVDQMVSSLTIPDGWHEIVQAYYLSEHGMSDFERGFHNARREMDLVRDLYEKRIIDAAEFDLRKVQIDRYIANIRPAVQPGAEKVLPHLHNFKTTWQQFESLEKRALLQVVFAGIFFDAEGRIRKVLAHSPFDELLDLSSVVA